MDTNHVWKVIDETHGHHHGNTSAPKKSPDRTTVRAIFTFLAVILSIILSAIGISWLAGVVTVLVSGKILGYTVFFGIPPFLLSILITSICYVIYWPLSLITKGFWSIAKNKNRYKNHEIITGAIMFSLAIAAIIIIAINLGRNINFNYRDANTRVIIDEGNICVSEEDYCEKF